MKKNHNFTEIFKPYKKNYKEKLENKDVKRKKTHYFLTILGYLLISVFAGLLISFLLKGVSKLSKKDPIVQTINEQIILEVYKNPQYFAISKCLDRIDRNNNKNIVDFVLEYQIRLSNNDYLIFVNKENKKLISFITFEDGSLNNSNILSLLKKERTKLGDVKVFNLYAYDAANATGLLLKDIFPFLDGVTIYKKELIFQSSKTDYYFDENIINFGVYVVLFVFVLLMLFKELRHDGKLFYKNINQNLYKIPAFFIGMFVVMTLFIDNLYLVMQKVLNYKIFSSVNQRSLELLLEGNAGILTVISAIILAPFVEELVFRKSFFKLIKSKSIALYTSSLIFGLIHCVGEKSPEAVLINLVSYMAGGIILGSIYLFSKKNIIIPIYCHLIWNAISFLI